LASLRLAGRFLSLLYRLRHTASDYNGPGHGGSEMSKPYFSRRQWLQTTGAGLTALAAAPAFAPATAGAAASHA